MTELVVQSESINWYQAATLAERLAADPTISGKSEFDPALAAKRLQRWRSQADLDRDLIFKQRLALDNLTEAGFLQLLGESQEAVQARFSETPDWVTRMEKAFSQPFLAENTLLPLSGLPNLRMAGFLEVIHPLLAQARCELRRGVEDLARCYAQLPFELNTIEDILLEGLAEQLVARLSPTLVMEIQVARLRGQLSGETPEARFDSFINLLRQPKFALNLLQEYKVLTRQLITLLQNRIRFCLEFLHHLCFDWADICSLFSPENEPGFLVKINGDKGDGHRGGRAVMMLEFSSGLTLVYKPRSLAVDLHFQELLDWLNRRGARPAFRTLKILNRDNHGWVEFVEAYGCTSLEEIQRFYERQGGYLAVLYALGAVDFHLENLLAAGEHPVLIDLEALFHPEISSLNLIQAEDLANQLMSYSVLQVGLLPQRIWTNKEAVGVELSGLGGEEGQLSPQPVPVWQDVGTDRMRLVRKQMPMPGGKNRPTRNGVKVNPLDHVDAILSGFTRFYRVLVAHRAELLAEDGPVAHFRHDTIRVVARATRTYAFLLEYSVQPDKLRDALELDRLFDKLWLEVKNRPSLIKLINAERYDLHQGDYPVFATQPASTTLWTSTGQPIEDFLSESGLNRVQRRLRMLGEADLNQQLWFIRASLTILAKGNEGHHPIRYQELFSPAPQEGFASREQLLAAARAVGDRLDELALRGEQDVSWISVNLERMGTWNLTTLNLTLYDGLPGVALFLAYLGACTGEARYTNLSKAALANVLDQIRVQRATLLNIGGLEGWGGIIYTLTHLGTLWNDPALLDEAESIVKLIPALIEQDPYLDFISGATGGLAALLSLYQCRPSSFTLATAIKCGEYLVAQAKPQKQGVAWLTHMEVNQPATGFGRGSSGISWALLQLATVTGDRRFRETGLAALSYERSVFQIAESNWPDFRTVGKAPLPENAYRYMLAWCHGAPGIGLARLSLLADYGDVEMQAEIKAALKSTLTSGFGGNHSICHGDLGNAELILEASRKFQDMQLSREVQRLSTGILASIEKHGWICSNPLWVETPGLLVGLSGIGYGLLRLAEPEAVPSVLLLEPPRK